MLDFGRSRRPRPSYAHGRHQAGCGGRLHPAARARYAVHWHQENGGRAGPLKSSIKASAPSWPDGEITAGEAVRATMGRCLTATPTPSSPTSIRPSARRSRSRPGRCASWPARGVARPGSSRDGSPTRSPPAWSGHATCWSSRSPTRPPARCVPGWRRSATRAWRPRRSMPPRSASSAISGRASTAATRRRSSNRRCRSSPRWRPACPAATGYLAGPRPRRRDRVGEGAPDPSERVRDAGDRRRPRRLACRPT